MVGTGGFPIFTDGKSVLDTNLSYDENVYVVGLVSSGSGRLDYGTSTMTCPVVGYHRKDRGP